MIDRRGRGTLALVVIAGVLGCGSSTGPSSDGGVTLVLRSAAHAAGPALVSSADTVFAAGTGDTVHLVASLEAGTAPPPLVVVVPSGDSVQLIVDDPPVPDSSLAPLGTWIQWSSSNGETVFVSTNGLVKPHADATITAELKPLVVGGYPGCDPTFNDSCPDKAFDPVIRALVAIHTP